MNNQILVSLPGFGTNKGIVGDDCGNPLKINTTLFDLWKSNRSIFNEGIVLDSVYDSFTCIWGGGRAIPNKGIIPTNEIEESLIPLLTRGIDIRFNFTNCLLLEKHLNDYNSNNILDTSLKIVEEYGKKLSIVINSPILENYLRQKYPQLKYVYSTTLGKLSLDDINKKTENNILVLDYNYNNNFDFLKQLRNPHNIEVLANENCVPNCPYREMHFKIYSAIQLNRIDIEKTKQMLGGCINHTKDIGRVEEKQVSYTEFVQNYLPLGINKLKIVGRGTVKQELVTDYVNWLIKPEYQKQVKELLLALD